MPKKWQYLLFFALLIPCWVVAYRFDIDLVNLHAAAIFSHTDLSRVYAQNGNLGRYFYGPFSLVLIYPFGAMEYPAVKFVWTLLQTLSYILFWFLLYRLYPSVKNSQNLWVWLAIFIFSINPIHNNFQSNNVQLMLAAAMLLAEHLSRQQKPHLLFMAGVLCWLTASIKIFPFFLVAYYFVAKPSWVQLGLVAGACISFLGPVFVFGTAGSNHLFADFFEGLGKYDQTNSLTKVPDILCLPSLTSRLFGETAATAKLTNLLILFLSVVFFGWVWFRKFNSLRTWATAMALMALFNPSTRPHYFIFYLPAFCSLFSLYEKKPSKKMLGLIGLSLCLIAFTTEFVVGKDLNNLLEARSLPTYGMILLVTTLISAGGDADESNDGQNAAVWTTGRIS